jgi:hypothetical protein
MKLIKYLILLFAPILGFGGEIEHNGWVSFSKDPSVSITLDFQSKTDDCLDVNITVKNNHDKTIYIDGLNSPWGLCENRNFVFFDAVTREIVPIKPSSGYHVCDDRAYGIPSLKPNEQITDHVRLYIADIPKLAHSDHLIVFWTCYLEISYENMVLVDRAMGKFKFDPFSIGEAAGIWRSPIRPIQVNEPTGQP